MNALQSLKNVRAIAEAAVRDLPGDFTIAAVLPGEARSVYAEVLVVRAPLGAEPTRVLLASTASPPSSRFVKHLLPGC